MGCGLWLCRPRRENRPTFTCRPAAHSIGPRQKRTAVVRPAIRCFLLVATVWRWKRPSLQHRERRCIQVSHIGRNNCPCCVRQAASNSAPRHTLPHSRAAHSVRTIRHSARRSGLAGHPPCPGLGRAPRSLLRGARTRAHVLPLARVRRGIAKIVRLRHGFRPAAGDTFASSRYTIRGGSGQQVGAAHTWLSRASR